MCSISRLNVSFIKTMKRDIYYLSGVSTPTLKSQDTWHTLPTLSHRIGLPETLPNQGGGVEISFFCWHVVHYEDGKWNQYSRLGVLKSLAEVLQGRPKTYYIILGPEGRRKKHLLVADMSVNGGGTNPLPATFQKNRVFFLFKKR